MHNNPIMAVLTTEYPSYMQVFVIRQDKKLRGYNISKTRWHKLYDLTCKYTYNIERRGQYISLFLDRT